MTETDAEEAVAFRCHQPPTIVDLLSVEESGRVAAHVSESAVGVEGCGDRMTNDEIPKYPKNYE